MYKERSFNTETQTNIKGYNFQYQHTPQSPFSIPKSHRYGSALHAAIQCFQVKNIKVREFTFSDKSNALGVVGSVRKMDKDAEETVTVRLRTAVDHSGTGGVGSAALPVIVPQERSAGTERLAIYVVYNITNLSSKSPIHLVFSPTIAPRLPLDIVIYRTDGVKTIARTHKISN